MLNLQSMEAPSQPYSGPACHPEISDDGSGLAFQRIAEITSHPLTVGIRFSLRVLFAFMI